MHAMVFFRSKTDGWQDAMKSIFAGGLRYRSNLSFKCNITQCTDIAKFLEDTDFLIQQYAGGEEWIHAQCEPAMKEFCNAITEAKKFLQDCSTDDLWRSITKIHTREAYDVLLHNLIWSKTGLDLAILYAAADAHPIEYKEIRRRVEECKSLVSRYTQPGYTQPRLSWDWDQFYCSVEKHKKKFLLFSETKKKRLTFLAQKFKAYQESNATGGTAQRLIDECEIDPLDVPVHEEKQLGEGSYGNVYRSSWLGQAVAVKVFKGVAEEVFKNEASLLAGLHNPFIVHMVGWWKKTNGDCILVMELADTDLWKVIDSAQHLSVHAAVDIMLQIAKGMEYLHKKGVIHRDIKPTNVLLNLSSVKQMSAAGHAKVKICDFGFAKLKESSAEDWNLYTTLNVGTSYYRAPEVLDDEGDKYSRKADVFSFAITCSEMLAGRSAADCYKKLKNRKVLRETMLANVRPNLPADCPSHLSDLIRSCWDKDPERRPPFSRICNTLTYIKFILMRVSYGQRLRPYNSVVSPFDEDELKRRLSEDGEFAGAREDGDSVLPMIESACLRFAIPAPGVLPLLRPSSSLVMGDRNSEFILDMKIPDYVFEEVNPDAVATPDLKAPGCPVLVFINSKSGGQFSELLKAYRVLLSPKQVFDLSEEKPDKVLHTFLSTLEKLKENGDKVAESILRSLKIIVVGGDGTAGWFLGVVGDLELSHPPPIAIVPLGIDNNLSYALGWGKNNPGTDLVAVEKYLYEVHKAESMNIDSWHVVMRMANPTGSLEPVKLPHSLHSFRRVSGLDTLHAAGFQTFRGGFWNYFSIGMDAKVAYEFHGKRQEHPEMFKNERVNQGAYATIGVTQGWFWANSTHPSSRNINNLGTIYIQNNNERIWKKLKIPKQIRSIVVLNVPSFLGGLNPWGNPSDSKSKMRNLTPAYVNDGLIELVGFRDGWHGLTLLTPNGHGTRLAQAHKVRIEFGKGFADKTYMRMDGEPWLQPLPVDDSKTIIEITHLGQAVMLKTKDCISECVPHEAGTVNSMRIDESDSIEPFDADSGSSSSEESELRRKFGAADTFKGSSGGHV